MRPAFPRKRTSVVGEEGQHPVVHLVADAGGDPGVEPAAADPDRLGQQLRGERGEQVEALVHAPVEVRRMRLVGGQRPGVLVADGPQRVFQGAQFGCRVDQGLGGESCHQRSPPEVQLFVGQTVAVVVEAAVRGERQVRHLRAPRGVRSRPDAGMQPGQRVGVRGMPPVRSRTGCCR
ncbi:hypothetical protein [Streptomyces sp. JH34]|uniref:hypothetical protein n=1 Tax=Streptomyces sp. JH34 TaxID=2793633 RepID=UPI0023F772FB|nr:hypothetical protein [Streptomyces sp. JH34]MDF6022553.1 hypothetical protein [Streptomyces sp. JH34]